ncbi:hypothetical protein GGE12_004626 [Rhizobium mongolense]|uniref:Uncharacterized protein n=1 Tax=Rhizobium mongolense TaxID=57676 RepID=A0A7W6WGJ5_9HYPH|nr:hypothetical protein [Rhizobium mongolense]
MIDLFVVGRDLTLPQPLFTKGRGLTGSFPHCHDYSFLHGLMESKTVAPSQPLPLVGRGWGGVFEPATRQEAASC